MSYDELRAWIKRGTGSTAQYALELSRMIEKDEALKEAVEALKPYVEQDRQFGYNAGREAYRRAAAIRAKIEESKL